MIHSQDRSGWFGASDTEMICGNYETKTFRSWWAVKLGLSNQHITTRQMLAGTMYEHEILKAIAVKDLRLDKQVRIKELRLRVNLDGNTHNAIYECKTYQAEKVFKPTRAYVRQVNVQMYATGIRKAYIVAYPMTEENYKNYFLKIDRSKIQLFNVEYDIEFINGIYLPRLKYLRDCLVKGVLPKGWKA